MNNVQRIAFLVVGVIIPGVVSASVTYECASQRLGGLLALLALFAA